LLLAEIHVCVCVCMCMCTFLILQVLEKYSTCFAMSDVMAGKISVDLSS
jgi:hypothetical protein